MHAIDIVLIIVIAGAVLAAVNSIRKQKKTAASVQEIVQTAAVDVNDR